jgi:hypothetical protein
MKFQRDVNIMNTPPTIKTIPKKANIPLSWPRIMKRKNPAMDIKKAIRACFEKNFTCWNEYFEGIDDLCNKLICVEISSSVGIEITVFSFIILSVAPSSSPLKM